MEVMHVGPSSHPADRRYPGDFRGSSFAWHAAIAQEFQADD